MSAENSAENRIDRRAEEPIMLIPKRKPITAAYVFKVEFLDELALSQQAVSELMGVSRKTVNELVNGKQRFTVDIALLLEKVFDTPPEFWLNLQRQSDLWKALNSARTKTRLAKAKAFRPQKKTPSAKALA